MLRLQSRATNDLPTPGAPYSAARVPLAKMPAMSGSGFGSRSRSYNQNLWMHHLTEGAAYLPL